MGSLVSAIIKKKTKQKKKNKPKKHKNTKQKTPNGSLVERVIKMSTNILLLDFNIKLFQEKRENRDLVVSGKVALCLESFI